jgi:hypothetical protein
MYVCMYVCMHVCFSLGREMDGSMRVSFMYVCIYYSIHVYIPITLKVRESLLINIHAHTYAYIQKGLRKNF